MTKAMTALIKDQELLTLYSPEDVHLLYEWPHLLGHLVGKTKLFEVHSRWIKYMWEDSPEFRALRAFRGSYKSTACVHIGPIYYHLFIDPNSRIFIIRKKFTDSADAIETIYDMMMSDEMQKLFKYVHGSYPKAKIKRKEKITWSFKETKTPEGSLNAFGIDNAITGHHGDRFLLDDFITLKDRVSRAERESTKEMVREVSTNVVDPGKPVGYMGTPWHKEDGWTICPTPWDFPIGSIPGILTDEEIIQKRKLTTSSLWAANYDLKHVPDDDALFREPKYGPWRDQGVQVIRAHIDAAWDGDHWCALTIMGRRSDGKIQAIGKSYAGNVKLWMGEIYLYYQKFRARKIYCEDNPDKGYVGDELKKNGMNVSTYTETTNKHIKISTYLIEAWNNIVWDEDETDSEYMNQILDYREKQEPDDGCFVAGTKVATTFGNKNIEDIRVGEKVLTPFGPKRVTVSGCTGSRPVIFKFGLTGTKDHRVYEKIQNNFVALDSLTTLMRVDRLSLRSLIKWEIKKQLYLMGKNILKAKRCDIISVSYREMKEKGQSNYIKQFGNFIIKEKFPRVIIYIIRILTQIIMTFLIYSCWKLLNIYHYMQENCRKTQNIGKRIEKLWLWHKKKRKNGMVVKKDLSGIRNTRKNLWQRFGRFVKNESANIVEKFIQQDILLKDSVQTFVETEKEIMLSINTETVFCAEKSFLLNQDRSRSTVVQDVKVERENLKTVPVYNLTVEGIGVYYANGILVSNCDSAASLIRACFSNQMSARAERWKW